MSPTRTETPHAHADRYPVRVPDRFAPPALPDGLVVRARLVTLLDRAVSKPVTLVSAPAGTGKTVTVASWAAHRAEPDPLVWLSLSPSNTDPVSLWTLLVDALRTAGVSAPGRVPVTAAGAPDPTALAALALAVAAHAEPVVLVLDCDSDLGPAVADGLRDLLHDSAGRLRLVVMTRSDPPLPLRRYALEDSLTEVRMPDLAFTAGEARDLLRRRGVDLREDVFDVVMNRTRGWVAGLLLATMSVLPLRDRERAVREITGATGGIAEYLLAEVLDVQSPMARDLLLRTSVAEVLRPGLAEALAGPKAPRALAVLARGNAFLEPVSERPGWFRFHPLFRDMLCAQLRFESPEEADRLHLAAANWAAREGLLEEAVRHALAAGRPGRATRFVVDDLAVVELLTPLLGGVPARVAALLDPLAPVTARAAGLADPAVDTSREDLADQVAADLVRAALARARGEPGRGRALLHSARDELADLGALWPAADLAMSLIAVALAASGADPDEQLRTVDEAVQLLPAQVPDRLAVHGEIAAWLQAIRASALLRLGRLGAAAESLDQAVAAKHRPGLELLHVQSLGRAALLAAWDGRARRATRLAQQAVDLQREAGVLETPDTVSAQVALAWVAVEACDLAAARRHAHLVESVEHDDESASAPARGVVDPLTRVMLALVQARIRRLHGDVDGARAALATARAAEDAAWCPAPDWLRDRLAVEEIVLDLLHDREPAVAVPELVPPPTREWAELVRAMDHLARGDGLDRPVSPRAQSDAALPVLVDSWLLESLRQARRGDERRAVEALDRSLRLAAPEELRRPFWEAPPEVRRLLRTRTDLAHRHSWLALDRDRTERPRGAARVVDQAVPATLVVEPLTQKEREVLAHLAELLTTEEIAGAMFVSVNTVRTHVRNILRKLGVSRRNEAIRRARELQIL